MQIFKLNNVLKLKIVLLKLEFCWAFSCLVYPVLGDEVCYPPYGCFNDEPPYQRALVKLPESPKVVGTKFMLYTRAQSANPDIISDADPSSIKTSTFDGRKATFFIVHGYLGNLLPYHSAFLFRMFVSL